MVHAGGSKPEQAKGTSIDNGDNLARLTAPVQASKRDGDRTPQSSRKRREADGASPENKPTPTSRKRIRSTDGKATQRSAKKDADSELEIDLTSEWTDDDAVEEPKRSQKGHVPSHAPPAQRTTEDDALEPPSTGKKRKNPTSPKASSIGTQMTTHSTVSASPKGPLSGIANDAEALKAVAAVNAASQDLPPEEELGMTLMPEGTFMGRAPDEPALHGQIEPPRGHPDCLTGKTFVISGVLESLTRVEAEDLIKRHGGKVTGNVSGRTSFLLVGHHAGPSKYHVAKQRGVKLINEKGLFHLIKATQPPTSNLDAIATEKNKPSIHVANTTRPTPEKPEDMHGSQRTTSVRVRPPDDQGMLWVEKWRPKSSRDLVGNAQAINTLRIWLEDWESVHLHGSQPREMPGARGKERANEMKKRAVLLSGSPGIGKTSSALIVARELGYEPVEVNASDARGKADSSVLKGVSGKLANSIKELSTNASVQYDRAGQRRRLCLIMDEVDGMSAGDRGGVADLIKTIHRSRIPIICICNDKYSQKLRSLRNHCLELDFRKPTVQQISKRMMDIARAEGLSMNQATMDALVQSANGGDIRLLLGQLQMIRLRATALSYDEVRSGGHRTSKDLEMSPFEAARRLLDADGAALSMADQIELVFQDADLVPLLVQENYLNHRPRIAPGEIHRLQVIAKAADGFSAGDIVNRSVRQYQNWSLMPFSAAMGTVNPASYMRGPREIFGLYPNEPNFPRFTTWLGQFSSGNKQRRLLGELHTRVLSSNATTADRSSLRLSYLPVLRMAMVRPLAGEEGKEAIPKVLSLMREYCISREDLDFIGDVCRFKTKASWGEDPFKSVPTQVKSALTRAFNQQHLRPKTGFGLDEAKKKRKKGGAEDEDEDVFGGGGIVESNGQQQSEMQQREEEEEEELDPVMLRRKLMSMKHDGLELMLKDGSKASTGKGSRGKKGGRSGSGRGRGGRSR